MDNKTFESVIDYMDKACMISEEQKSDLLAVFKRNQELEIGKVYHFTGADCKDGVYGVLTGFCNKKFVVDDGLIANSIGEVNESILGRIK